MAWRHGRRQVQGTEAVAGGNSSTSIPARLQRRRWQPVQVDRTTEAEWEGHEQLKKTQQPLPCWCVAVQLVMSDSLQCWFLCQSAVWRCYQSLSFTFFPSTARPLLASSLDAVLSSSLAPLTSAVLAVYHTEPHSLPKPAVSVMSQFSSFSRPSSSSGNSAVRKPYEESKEAVSFGSSAANTNVSTRSSVNESTSSRASTIFKQRAIYSDSITQQQQQQQQQTSPSYQHEHKEQYSVEPSQPFSSSSVHPSPPLPLSLFRGNKLPSPPPLPQQSTAPTRLQPKVIVPFEHQSSSLPPRRIAIERKKRQYAAQSLSTLLSAHGINYSLHSPQHDHVSGLPSYLLLRLFDDVEYETYTPDQWLQFGPIEGRSLRLDAAGHGDYVACTVLEYSSARDEWRVQFDDSGVSSWTCRLDLHMAVEDPQLYVARVANAHKQRREAEAALRCALYVDCMPIDDLSGMDAEQVNRILFLSLNTKKMRVNNNDTTQLINEIQLDYSRTINALIYNAHQQTDATKARTGVATAINCPDYATVRIPAHDFAAHFTSFCFHSFMTKPEAIVSLIRVNAECQKLHKTPLLQSAYSKPVRVDEFSGSQHATISGLQSYLHDKLLVNVTTAIRQGLKDVDKGWLNLHEKSRELYDFSKLKRLMTRINFMIGDAVRTCALQAMADYVAMIERACQYDVVVHGLKDAQLTLRDGNVGAGGNGGEAPSGQPAVQHRCAVQGWVCAVLECCHCARQPHRWMCSMLRSLLCHVYHRSRAAVCLSSSQPTTSLT